MENSFLNLEKVIRYASPFLAPFSFLCTERWHSEKEILQLAKKEVVPSVILLSSLSDEVVPPAHMFEIYNIFKRNGCTNVNIKYFPKASHNDVCTFDGYFETIQVFTK